MTERRTLTNLPTELLLHILYYLPKEKKLSDLRSLCLACKRLHQVAAPLLIEHLRFDPNTRADGLFRNLLQNSALRKRAKRITIVEKYRDEDTPSGSDEDSDSESNDGNERCNRARRTQETSDQFQFLTCLTKSELKGLARCAEELLPPSNFLERLKARLRLGLQDGCIVLLIIWATESLTHLEIGVPWINQDRMFIHELVQFVYKERLRQTTSTPRSSSHTLPSAMSSLQTNPRESLSVDESFLPLHNLQEIYLTQDIVELFADCNEWSAIFYLPNLRIFRAYRLGMENGKAEIPWPHRTSSVEAIYLEEWCGTEDGLRHLITAPKSLRKLHAYNDYGPYRDEIRFNILDELSDVIISHHDTLEELILALEDVDDPDLSATGPEQATDLSCLHQLRALDMDVKKLARHWESINLPVHLPPSLEYLHICNASVDQLRHVISECVQGGRFERLREIVACNWSPPCSKDDKEHVQHLVHELRSAVKVTFLKRREYVFLHPYFVDARPETPST